MSGGLIGMINRGASGATGSIRAHDQWAIRLVFVAGIVTIVHKAGILIPAYSVIFAICLGIAALLYEMNATTNALRAFWQGKPGSAIGWAFIWVVAFGYSMNQWVGAASENEAGKSAVQKAAYTTMTDNRAGLASAKKEMDRIQTRIDWMNTAVNGRAVRGIEAAQADMDNAQAHKFWKSTDGCKQTNGPQTREFCSNFAGWRAEKALASELETLKAELAPAKAAYATAQSTATGTRTVVSEARSDFIVLTKYAGLKEDDARTITALGSILAISIFLSFATALKELDHLRNSGPRVKVFPIARWYDSLKRMLYGAPSVDQQMADAARNGRIEVNQTLVDNRSLPEAARMIAAMTERFGAKAA